MESIANILLLILLFQFIPKCQKKNNCGLASLACSKEACDRLPLPSGVDRASCYNNVTSIRNQNRVCFSADGPFAYGIYDAALPVISSNSLTVKVFLHAVMARKRKMQLRCRDMEWWMKRRQLPSRLRQRVRQYERQRWAAMRGEDEVDMVKDLPEGLRRDIRRHLCLDLIKQVNLAFGLYMLEDPSSIVPYVTNQIFQVPLFQNLDDLILDNICDRVKHMVFSKDEKVIREGDPVQCMVFVVRGRLQSSQRLSKGVVATCMLGPGNFLGDELLSWCLRRPFTDRLPASSATFACVDHTEAFGLDANHLRYITEHFRYKFANDRLKRTARYYSTNWRTWAAVNIQLAWRRYKTKTRAARDQPAELGDNEQRLRLYAAIFMSIRPHDHLEYSETEPVQTQNQQSGTLHGPVAILWDIENCPVPSDVRPEDVAGNIRMALRVHPVIKGAVTMFSAYGDFNAFPRRLREGCQRTGVKLVDVPNGRKDAADKAILVDMFLFALDNQPPSSIMLISGDVDFAPALHILGQRGYTVILVIPAGVGVSSALSNAGRFVWDWPSVARGEGFVPAKAYMPRVPDHAGCLSNCSIGATLDIQNEEEAIVYKGISQNEYGGENSDRVYCYNSNYMCRGLDRSSYSMTEYRGSNSVNGSYFTSSRSQSLPSGLSEGAGMDQNVTQEQAWWVRPGDLQGLKGQIVRLLEMSGGSMPLVRVPSEYLKFFGRPLYVAEYGVCKLVNLIRKMADALVVVGKGHKKLLCLRNAAYCDAKRCPGTPALVRKDKKGKQVLEENMDVSISPHSGCSSDELSDDGKNDDPALGAADELEDQFESVRHEVQELLVCYSCPVPLGTFEALYKQRYKKDLDYRSYGVDSLEELMEKLRDIVELCVDQGSKRKFLVLSSESG
ncbi:hypothetical protein B296_00042334 [Ensete ventricosum]|uniref:HTH OST-type domain-containing protein n=1 Tax=Ensete ventricosum TaxID=4639 RepID=A0A426YH26_ENSVE|nr:hypothetical protein B296_00042334 [Ensete ventricosum]